jgi:hypothetical protein
VKFEMTLTREELLRLLPGAVDGPFQAEGDAYIHREPGRTWRLRATPLPPLVLGSLSLPRLALEFDFQGYGDGERQAFLARFQERTRKGGG